jgi:hypothetical protein
VDDFGRLAGVKPRRRQSDSRLPPAFRALLIVGSTLGTAVAATLGWMSHEAYLAFEKLADAVHKTEIVIANYEGQRLVLMGEIARVVDSEKDLARTAWDHEKRMVRLELVGVPVPLPPPEAPRSSPPPVVAIDPKARHQ